MSELSYIRHITGKEKLYLEKELSYQKWISGVQFASTLLLIFLLGFGATLFFKQEEALIATILLVPAFLFLIPLYLLRKVFFYSADMMTPVYRYRGTFSEFRRGILKGNGVEYYLNDMKISLPTSWLSMIGKDRWKRAVSVAVEVVEFPFSRQVITIQGKCTIHEEVSLGRLSLRKPLLYYFTGFIIAVTSLLSFIMPISFADISLDSYYVDLQTVMHTKPTASKDNTKVMKAFLRNGSAYSHESREELKRSLKERTILLGMGLFSLILVIISLIQVVSNWIIARRIRDYYGEDLPVSLG